MDEIEKLPVDVYEKGIQWIKNMKTIFKIQWIIKRNLIIMKLNKNFYKLIFPIQDKF